MVKSFWKSYKKTHEIHKNKVLFRYFNYVPIDHRNVDKHKKNHLKRTLKIRSNFDHSKVHN